MENLSRLISHSATYRRATAACSAALLTVCVTRQLRYSSIDYVINYYAVVYMLIIYITIFCHGTSLKKPIWPCLNSNLRRRYQ